MASRRATLGMAGRALRASTAAAPAYRVAISWTTMTAATRPATISRLAAAKPMAARWYSQGSEIPDSEAWDFKMMSEQVASPKENIVLVDVREPLELQETGKIPGAINIPVTTAIQSFHVSPDDFADMYGFERPGKDKALIFYCRAGVRAKAAAGLAKHAGWDKVGVYAGSWLDWDKEGGKVERVKMGEGVQRN